jgi:hypothetical protein
MFWRGNNTAFSMVARAPRSGAQIVGYSRIPDTSMPGLIIASAGFIARSRS